MSGSNRVVSTKAGLIKGSIFASVICVLIIGWGLLRSADYEREADNHRAEYAEYTGEKVAEACIGIPALERIKCVDQAFEAKRDYEANQYDLEAQRKSALWAYIMGAAAVVGMALSAVGVWLVKTTFEEARAGNAIARDAQRAWVTLSAKPQNFHCRQGVNLRVRFDVEAKNLGQSAAINFDLNVAVFFQRQGESGSDLNRTIMEHLKGWKAEEYSPENASLLPSDTEIDQYDVTFPDEVIHWWDLNVAAARRAMPILVAAAFYRTVSTPKIQNVVWRSWYIGRSGSGNHFDRGLHETHGTIAATHLDLRPHFQSLMHEECPANHDKGHHEV